MLLKQSTNRVRPILLVLAADGDTPATGKTLVITAKKDSGAFATITPTVTERVNGWYDLSLTSAHTDTLGAFCLHLESSDGLAQRRDIDDEVVVDLPGATVASVTGNVAGNVVGSVATVTGAVGSVTGNVGGNVVGDVQGTVALSASARAALWNWAAGLESYAADGAVPTPFQLLLMIWSAIAEATKVGTTVTTRRLDGTTVAMTFTLDSATAPTSVTRAS